MNYAILAVYTLHLPYAERSDPGSASKRVRDTEPDGVTAWRNRRLKEGLRHGYHLITQHTKPEGVVNGNRERITMPV